MNMSSYTGNDLKTSDYYRYICCLFTDSILRERLLALYLFNFEISKVKDITSEPMTGLIRLTWWREAIDEIYSGKPVRKHDVVTALANLINSVEIPHEYFEQMILAREVDIGLTPVVTWDDFQGYIDQTSVVLFKASLRAIGINNDALAYHIGSAYGIIGQLRALKWNADKKHLILPQDILNEDSINIDDIAEGKNLDKIKPITIFLCNKAKEHLKNIKILKKSLPATAMPVYLQSVVAEYFLGRIGKCDYDLFHSDLENRRFGILIKIFLAAKFY